MKKKLYSYCATLGYNELFTFLFTSLVFYASLFLSLPRTPHFNVLFWKRERLPLKALPRDCVSPIKRSYSVSSSGGTVTRLSRSKTNMSESSVGNADTEEEEHPWPHIESMFTLVKVRNSSYTMRCLLCLPKQTDISAFKNSTSNLRKHVAVSFLHFSFTIFFFFAVDRKMFVF